MFQIYSVSYTVYFPIFTYYFVSQQIVLKFLILNNPESESELLLHWPKIIIISSTTTIIKSNYQSLYRPVTKTVGPVMILLGTRTCINYISFSKLKVLTI